MAFVESDGRAWRRLSELNALDEVRFPSILTRDGVFGVHSTVDARGGAAEAGRSSAYGRHVLIVSESLFRSKALRALLEAWGVRVTVRPAGAAQTLTRAVEFDAVVSLNEEPVWMLEVAELRLLSDLRRKEAHGIVEDLLLRWKYEPNPTYVPLEVWMGALCFDVASATLYRGMKRVALTSLEARMLSVLALRAFMPVTRTALRPDLRAGRAVDVSIVRLRRRIEPDPARPIYLRTVRSRGFALWPDAVSVKTAKT